MSGLRLYRRLLAFLRPHLGHFIPAVAFMVLFAAFSSLSVTMLKPFTDIVLEGESLEVPAAPVAPTAPEGVPLVDSISDTGTRLQAWALGLLRGEDRLATFARFCVALFLITLLKNIFRYAQSVLMVGVEERIIRDIRNVIFGHYLGLPLRYFSESRQGHLVSRIVHDVNLVRGAIAGVIAKGLRQSLLAVAYIVAALWASWKLFLVTILIAPVCFGLIDLLGRRIRRYGRRSQEEMGDLTTILDETIGGVRIVKAFGLEGDRSGRFVGANDRYRKTMTRLARVGTLAPPLTETLGMAAGIGIIWIAGRDIILGQGMDPGRFMVFIGALFGVMQPVRILSNVNVEIQRGLAAAARIFELLDTEDRIEDAERPAPAPTAPVPIAFEGVAFGYAAEVPVLHDVTFVAHPGQVIGLVGASGAGKSTLVDLIPRFYDPDRGRILWGSTDARELPLRELRARIGYVSQDTILFHDTVTANVGFGRPGAAGSEIEEACRRANAHAFIQELPDGYDTVIGDRGAKLSGGQRQRLAIARALLKDPPVLLLDEATSALDTESERLVTEAIDRLLEGRTTFVIAHRLSTIRRADQILVLDRGRVVERGTHDELLAHGGRYRRLHDLQLADPGAGEASPPHPANTSGGEP